MKGIKGHRIAGRIFGNFIRDGKAIGVSITLDNRSDLKFRV